MRDRKKAHKFGLSAETAAAWLLRLKGYSIIAERYRNPFGEIDILARRGSTLAFVEVKARRDFRACVESITADKQKRLANAASSFLAYPGKFACSLTPPPATLRFDVIMVVPWRMPRHMPDAWRL